MIYQKIKTIFNSYKAEEKWYLLIITLLYLVYTLIHIFRYPVFIDEAITFNEFTTQGFLTSITYYPSTNNHIFFSILTNLSYYLPFDPLVNLRIPNLIIGCTASIFVYHYIKSVYGHLVAVIPHLFFTFSFFVTFYSVFARGYMCIILLTMICFISVQKVRDSFQVKHLTIYTLACIIGFYTIPIFLYVFLSLIACFLFYFINKKKQLITLIKYHLFIMLVVVLLYTPIIYYNGADAIMSNNKWLKPLSFLEIVAYFQMIHPSGIYDKIVGVKSAFILICYFSLLVIRYITTSDEKEKYSITSIALFFILPFFYILLHHIPGTRLWSYLLFPFTFGVALLTNAFHKIYPLPKILIYTIGVAIIILQIRVFHKTHPKAVLDRDIIIGRLSETIREKKYTTFHFEQEPFSFEEVSIKFAYLRKKNPIKIINLKSNNYNITDTITDCYVLNQNSNFIATIPKQKYKLVYEDDLITIFGKH